VGSTGDTGVAGTATAAVTPGTTSKSTTSRGEGLCLLRTSRGPKTNGSPPLSRNSRQRPGAALLHEQVR